MLQLDVLAHLASRTDPAGMQAHITHASLQALLQHAHSLLPEPKQNWCVTASLWIMQHCHWFVIAMQYALLLACRQQIPGSLHEPS